MLVGGRVSGFAVGATQFARFRLLAAVRSGLPFSVPELPQAGWASGARLAAGVISCTLGVCKGLGMLGGPQKLRATNCHVGVSFREGTFFFWCFLKEKQIRQPPFLGVPRTDRPMCWCMLHSKHIGSLNPLFSQRSLLCHDLPRFSVGSSLPPWSPFVEDRLARFHVLLFSEGTTSQVVGSLTEFLDSSHFLGCCTLLVSDHKFAYHFLGFRSARSEVSGMSSARWGSWAAAPPTRRSGAGSRRRPGNPEVQ